jgi:hypothetical protein
MISIPGLAEDPMILLLEVNYQTARHTRKMVTIMIAVHAHHQSLHTPRKLAIAMILILLAQDPVILPPYVNYQIAHYPRKMATISISV